MKRWVPGLVATLGLAVPLTALEGFESGWGGWTATGLWHRAVAPACFTPYEGAAAAYFGRGGSCDYADGLVKDASLTSPAVALTDPETAFVSFWLLYQVESFQPSCYDVIRLERSEDGVNWALLRNLGPASDPPGGGPGYGYASGSGLGGPPLWRFVKVDLGAFVPGTLRLRFRFLSSARQAGEPLCGAPDADMDGFLGVAVDAVRFGEPGPRLSLAKSVEPGFGPPGAALTYSLVVRNDAATAQDIAVWDTLPAGLDFVAADHGGVFSAGRVDWALPAVPAGEALTLRLSVQAQGALAAPQDLTNSAAALGALGGGAQASGQTLYRLREQGLQLLHSASPPTVFSGQTATFSLLVANYTPATQTALSLQAQLPAGLLQRGAYPGFSGPLRWDLAPLGPGQARSFSLWGPVFGEDGSVVTVIGRLFQAGGLAAQRPAHVGIRAPIEPSVRLRAVYPNPAPSDKPGLPQVAHIYFETNVGMELTLDIFTVAGEKVRSLALPWGQGPRQAVWDLANEHGRPVASGVYAFRLWSDMLVIPTPQAWGYIAVLR